MDVYVRTATGADAEAVALAHIRAWQVAYAGIVPADYLAALDPVERTAAWRQNLTEAALANGTPAPRNLVAEVDGAAGHRQVVGFSCVGVWRDAPADHLGELWAMYVHPDYWGAGAGPALMQATTEHFRATRVTTGYLWVLEDNPRARRFYERNGWKENDITQDEPIEGTSVISRRYSLTLAGVRRR